MRTMAGVWFSVIVLVSIQTVFGNDVCLKKDNEFTCNECIRCGGEWCNDRGSPHCVFATEDSWCVNGHENLLDVDEVTTPGGDVDPVYAERNLYITKPNKLDIHYSAKSKQKSPHCVFATEDSWCVNGHENLLDVDEVTTPGGDVDPVYAERNLYITKPNKLDIHYSAKSKQKPEMRILQSTQSFNIELKQYGTECSGSSCVTTIEATPSAEFCNVTGGTSEYVDVRIKFGLNEEARIKYHVACACPCSENVTKNSPLCNRNGNFSCGVCSCDPGWTGEFCDMPICDEAKRGDVVQCSLNPRNDADCSGNGYCSICETCICYKDREGSQYFEQENNCAGLCSVVASEWEDCLVNDTIGECYKDGHSMIIQSYNESLTKQKDTQNRIIWVKCSETIDDCGRLEYFAKRNENGKIHVMMLNHCNVISAVAFESDTKVSIILGVLAMVAAVAAVGGVMLWKHLNTVPPVPLNDPQYQNIDAEDCTGENPLYKPPTSSFKNPTYGKW